MRSSKLHLVDLAGSERIHKTDPDSVIKNEAKYINKSLSFLEQVIVALHKRAKGKKEAHVPYRNSMMTQILKDSLGGNCKTVMVATLALDKSNEDETLSTARFAHRCQKLVNDISINEQHDLATVVKKLQEQNIELSKRLF
jgi:kinesin family protein 6/9